ncbi:Uncharacterised protein [Burkholderia pseudomallei]|nr:Uncharacterised protein [Burkholderia pseudomallei]
MRGDILLRVPRERQIAVDELQQQEIGDFGHAAAPRLRQALAERLAALREQPVQLARVAQQHRIALRDKPRRNVAVVDEQPPIGAPLDDARDAERLPVARQFGFEHQAHVQAAGLQ